MADSENVKGKQPGAAGGEDGATTAAAGSQGARAPSTGAGPVKPAAAGSAKAPGAGSAKAPGEDTASSEARAEDGKGAGRVLPLAAGAAILAGIVGAIVVATRDARRKVLGVKVPWGSRSAPKTLGGRLSRAGERAGELPGVKQLRRKISG